MNDGLRLSCYPVGIDMYVPRKLEKKVMGMAGAEHPDNFYGRSSGYRGHGRNSKQTKYEWAVGTNAANVKKLNQRWGSRKAGMYASQDWETLVIGKQIPNLAKPPGGGGAGNSCRSHYQYGIPSSEYNGNRPWKGIAKMMVSWRVDDNDIPSVFGGVFEKVKNGGRNHWHMLTPAFGVNKKKPSGAKELAQKGCQSVKPFQKAFADCIFDFMAMGAEAAKKNLKARKKARAGKSKKPNLQSVRDASGGGSHGKWVGHPSWGCVDEFSLHVTKMAKEAAAAKFRNNKKAEMCKCQHKYLGVCAYDHFICIADIKLS